MEEDMAEDRKSGIRKISECQDVEERVEEDSGDEVCQECDVIPYHGVQTTTWRDLASFFFSHKYYGYTNSNTF